MRLFFLLACFSFLTLFAFGDSAIHNYPELQIQPPSADDGEVLIDFQDDQSVSALSALLSKLGVTKDHYAWFSQEEHWLRLRGVGQDILRRLQASAKIEDIEPNYYMTAFFVPNDPYYKYQWNLDLIGMRKAWDYPPGASVTVAVIDTGIAYEQYNDRFRVEDFGTSQFVSPYNFVKGNQHANDDHGHGTHVAGTIAQLTNNGVGVAGVSQDIKLMPLKVLNSYGYGTISDIAAAIRYAADHGARVINMSLGGPFPSFILHKAVRYAYKKGVTIVCAAGNSGRSGISYPANYSECISVSAVRFDKRLTWYSSYGKGLTISAPGGDMNVDQNGDGLKDGILQNTLDPQDPSKQGYFLFQGTSMATPHVAAAAALLISHGIEDPEAVRSYLQRSATPVEGGSPDQYGAGVVNADQALRSAFFMRNVKIFLFAAVLLIALLAGLNRKRLANEKVAFNALALLGLLMGSTGFFMWKFPVISRLFFFTHPVSEWEWGLFGAGSANALFFSVLPAVVVLFLCYPWKRMIPLSVAFSAGVASFLLFAAFSPVADIAWIPGRLLETGWLMTHAILALILATIASFRLR